jgi:hypothetical protein
LQLVAAVSSTPAPEIVITAAPLSTVPLPLYPPPPTSTAPLAVSSTTVLFSSTRIPPAPDTTPPSVRVFALLPQTWMLRPVGTLIVPPIVRSPSTGLISRS